MQANPAALNCTVTNGTGTMSQSGVTNVSISCGAGTVSTLYSFGTNSNDGTSPNGYASLVQASDGNFYGMTAGGGTAALGTVFKITPAGAETVLYSFKGPEAGATNADGAAPTGNLTQGSDGNLYGMTEFGGPNGTGEIFKIATDGTNYTVLHSFASLSSTITNADGASPTGGLIQGSDGNFYGMTMKGGASSGGTIFKISATGTTYTVLHSFVAGNNTDGVNPYGNLIQGKDGNFYGLTSQGGSNGSNGTIFEITADGVTYNVLHSFGSGDDGTVPFGSLIQASDGNFYGMTSLGGSADAGTIFRFAQGGTNYAVLYTFGSDFYEPTGTLLQANDGNLYGVAAGGGGPVGAIFQVTLAGQAALIYSFPAAAGGNAFAGNLIQVSNGNLYGLTTDEGTDSVGSVYVLN